MRYYCNPINVPYAYQFKKDPRDKYQLTVNREAADPSMVEYHGKYYLRTWLTGKAVHCRKMCRFMIMRRMYV